MKPLFAKIITIEMAPFDNDFTYIFKDFGAKALTLFANIILGCLLRVALSLYVFSK